MLTILLWQHFFQKSVQLIWPEEICFESILLVTTDAAPYMIKAMKGLKVLYPRMTHVTCLAHGLHRVAELTRKSYPQLNDFIASTKAIFVKTPLRIQKFKDMAPGIPVPPSPVLTRWGTWLDAVRYYSEHFELIHSIVHCFNPEDAESIRDSIFDAGFSIKNKHNIYK